MLIMCLVGVLLTWTHVLSDCRSFDKNFVTVDGLPENALPGDLG